MSFSPLAPETFPKVFGESSVQGVKCDKFECRDLPSDALGSKAKFETVLPHRYSEIRCTLITGSPLPPSSRDAPFYTFHFSEFQRLMRACANKVFIHRAARPLSITSSNRVIDPPVKFRRFPQITI